MILLQMLNIEIFKAPRVGEIDVYERLALDVAAMKVLCPPYPMCVVVTRTWVVLVIVSLIQVLIPFTRVLRLGYVQVCIPHEFFVLLYDFFFEAEKKAFLQVCVPKFLSLINAATTTSTDRTLTAISYFLKLLVSAGVQRPSWEC